MPLRFAIALSTVGLPIGFITQNYEKNLLTFILSLLVTSTLLSYPLLLAMEASRDAIREAYTLSQLKTKSLTITVAAISLLPVILFFASEIYAADEVAAGSYLQYAENTPWCHYDLDMDRKNEYNVPYSGCTPSNDSAYGLWSVPVWGKDNNSSAFLSREEALDLVANATTSIRTGFVHVQDFLRFQALRLLEEAFIPNALPSVLQAFGIIETFLAGQVYFRVSCYSFVEVINLEISFWALSSTVFTYLVVILAIFCRSLSGTAFMNELPFILFSMFMILFFLNVSLSRLCKEKTKENNTGNAI
eukprot:g638.t1